MPDHLLCHGCIDEPVLSAEVLASGTAGRCYHCERKRKAWPLSRLAERIHGVLQANYSPTYPGPHDYAGWGMSGDDVADTITELAGLDDSDIGRDIQAILSDRYGYAARYSGDIDPYGDDVSYVFAPADTSEHSLSWTAFCDLLKTESRFFNSAAREMLADLFGELERLTTSEGPVIRALPAGARAVSFYRARVATSLPMLEKILGDPARELAAPPHAHARAGRMNGAGISLFYGALDIETCVAEIRAPVGSHVAIMAFKNVRPLRLLDLARLRSISIGGSLFADDYRQRYEHATFLGRLVDELSKPIMPGSEEMDYLPTQAVAEYLADRHDLELDGLLFPSSQTADEHLNVALFHQASRSTGKRLPDGCSTSMLGPRRDEDGEPDDICIWIEKPRRKRARRTGNLDPLAEIFASPPRIVRPDPDDDWRVPTLKWVPGSLEVRTIKGVTYEMDRHSVSRRMEPKRKYPLF